MLRQFSDGQIRTIGDLASLTEEQLDRLSVKPPKRTNVCCVLEVKFLNDVFFNTISLHIVEGFLVTMMINESLYSNVIYLAFTQDFEKQHSNLTDGVSCSKFLFSLICSPSLVYFACLNQCLMVFIQFLLLHAELLTNKSTSSVNVEKALELEVRHLIHKVPLMILFNTLEIAHCTSHSHSV